ncbi:MAG: universal stress protein [Gaiellaceae bacterium]
MGRVLGYRSILVPLADNLDTETALDVACKLAAEHGARLVAVAVVEVPPLLPLDAQMQPEEGAAQRLLARARAVAESYGVHFVDRVARGREAATPIVELARSERTELIVMGAPRRVRPRRSAPAFGHTTQSLLKRAPCRVMVLAAPASVVPVPSAPEWLGASSSSVAVRSS